MTTNNKDIVQRALSALLGTRNVDALTPFMTEDFVHHRPDARRTKSEWLAAVQAALVPLAGMDVAIQHLVADGDHVVMHSRRRLPAGPEIVVVDIFRLEAGRIAEAWEVIEPAVDATANFKWWERAKR
ncbi:MAG: SnoaL-like domain-containing protein [Polyangiaceae bacterium]|nr:SnoaL-like domain-containing protein [Polyangiaceae bacterium]